MAKDIGTNFEPALKNVKNLERYAYKVNRMGNSVFYIVFKDGNTVTSKEVLVTDLPFWQYMSCTIGSEECIAKLYPLAHEIAQFAIETMKTYEKD